MDLKAGGALSEQQIAQGTKKVRARVGKSKGRAWGWGGPSLCYPAFWLGAQCLKPQSTRF